LYLSFRDERFHKGNSSIKIPYVELAFHPIGYSFYRPVPYLDEKILCEIFKLLDWETLLNVSLVSKRFFEISKRNDLWVDHLKVFQDDEEDLNNDNILAKTKFLTRKNLKYKKSTESPKKYGTKRKF